MVNQNVVHDPDIHIAGALTATLAPLSDRQVIPSGATAMPNPADLRPADAWFSRRE
jgi:hypothetical protein